LFACPLPCADQVLRPVRTVACQYPCEQCTKAQRSAKPFQHEVSLHPQRGCQTQKPRCHFAALTTIFKDPNIFIRRPEPGGSVEPSRENRFGLSICRTPSTRGFFSRSRDDQRVVTDQQDAYRSFRLIEPMPGSAMSSSSGRSGK